MSFRTAIVFLQRLPLVFWKEWYSNLLDDLMWSSEWYCFLILEHECFHDFSYFSHVLSPLVCEYFTFFEYFIFLGSNANGIIVLISFSECSLLGDRGRLIVGCYFCILFLFKDLSLLFLVKSTYVCLVWVCVCE